MVTETRSLTTRPLAAIALVASLAAGCGTFVAYPGEARPEQAIATLACYTRYYFVYLGSCGITAVSGKRSDAILHTTVGLARHGATLYAGTLQIADDAPSGASETRAVSVTCRPFGGALCRVPSDCGRPAEGWPAPRCEMRPEHPFGRCVHPTK